MRIIRVQEPINLLRRVQSHKAETAVLEPDTEYVYSVGDGAMNVTDVKSPASFKTPASDIDTFNFNWVTDVHASPSSSHNGKALEQAYTDFPDASFILSSGDQISYAFDTSQWDVSLREMPISSRVCHFI